MLKHILLHETIVAVSTPLGEGGIGIVRLSGEQAVVIAGRIFKAKNGKSVDSQRSFSVRYGYVVDSEGKTVDEALLLIMRAPKSYTGEDVAEISVHGGQAVLQTIIRLALFAGARLAQPGEFTKRAFLNGKLDLVQAEAVLEMIQAKTDRALSWASAQLDGTLSKKIKIWKNELVGVLSHLEASIEFPDDYPETDSILKIQTRLQMVFDNIEALLSDSELAFIAKRGFKVVLWGKPNVGKSSLLNQLTRKDRVIVTPYPGTTRDVVEEEALVGGFPLRFHDTAGIRDTEHPIEKEGIEKSKKAMLGADLILMVLDSSQPIDFLDKALLEEIRLREFVIVLNKTDLESLVDIRELESLFGRKVSIVSCSCIRENGIKELERVLLEILTRGKANPSEEALVTTARQKDLLEKVSKAIFSAIEILKQTGSPELASSDLRQGLDYLGALVGEVVTDDILEVLFQQFCIGK